MKKWLLQLTGFREKSPGKSSSPTQCELFEVTPQNLARATVEIGAILRKYGIRCQYNEDFNVLQGAIEENFLDEWLGIEISPLYGAFEHWESIHQELGIERPRKDK